VVLEEVEEVVALGIDPDLVLALGQGHALEDEDPSLDLIQEVALSLSPDQTLEIALNLDLLEILLQGRQEENLLQQETDLDPDQHPELKKRRDLRMEIDLHLKKEKLQDLVPALVHDLDREVIRSGLEFDPGNTNQLPSNIVYWSYCR